jgi:septal ring-binding cell division protein DamX
VTPVTPTSTATVTATPQTPTATATVTATATATVTTPPATKTVLVDAATCDVAECPPYSSFVGGFTISIHDDATGTVLDTCTTPEDGSECELVIPANVDDFYFSWNADDVPEGYSFKEVRRTTGSTGPVVYTLVLVPTSSELVTLHVNAATCTAAECPPYDDFISGIDIFAREDGTNTILAYCTTPAYTQNNSCVLEIPADVADYYLDYAPEGVPAGFVFSHIDVSDGEMGPVTYTLIFVPEEPVTPTATATHEPTHAPTHPATHAPTNQPTHAPTQAVSVLPSTGQGTSDSASAMTMIAMVSGASLLLAGAWLIRSRSRA